ncbi:flavodoxin family protein [Alloscardovia theropitheci]|uniref:Flavodoxin family protein n=1 Tax=Alloscardovia theropitheci TaxID=2496842 RepID=A0A4R0QRC1_9BIFI|nr:NAD(P)H-dependent oxidoreductase [Alloscardovia theropitheci]TCD53575.1 flavodoxin family protein [Alloscardovia theropitheci]
MENILIVSGHTYPENSIANKHIISLLKKQYPDTHIDDLYTLYPDYRINVASEQEKLKNADIIIIQSPIFWYYMTSLVSRWIEEVFTYGWAYGSSGNALSGKKIIFSVTAGADNEFYNSQSSAEISIDEMMKPYIVSANYCSMDYVGTVFTGGMMNFTELSTSDKENYITMSNKLTR